MQVYVLWIVACILALSVGFYLFSITASKSMKTTLASINRNVHKKRKHEQLPEKLFELLKVHSRIKQLSHSLNSFPITSTSLYFFFVFNFKYYICFFYYYL